ncbi:MAG: hypothetical protein R8G66_06470 [Cytophagales bacterium]|nr:hypothetical protein [Cytophagales bacterium]
MKDIACASEELVNTDLLLKLIAEDIKLNHLHFGLSDLGIVLEIDILGIGEIVFDLTKPIQTRRESYYQKVNELRRLTYKELSEQLELQSKIILQEILLP